MSNSKLTPDQKVTRKALMGGLREHFGAENVAVALHGGVTVVLVRTGKLRGMFAAAIASEGEEKIRRKVGEYVALWRFDCGNALPVALHDQSGEDAQWKQQYLADRAADLAASLLFA